MHLIKSLKDKNIIKTGDFILKSGTKSKLYFDFKGMVSHPDLMTDVSYELSKLVIDNVALCGVPLGGISYSVLVSQILMRPMVLLREEKKSYGMGNQIEGSCNGQVILIEDVITTGQSVISCIEILKANNIVVKQVVCILDREAGGVTKIKDMGYNISTLYTMNDILNYTENNDIKTCAIGNKLLDIINNKKTNLIASLDCDNLYENMEKVGDHVCAVKVHGDIYDNLDYDKINELKMKYNFMVIEDRKFSDIPYICLKQLDKIIKYADIVTVHGICGELMVQQIGKKVGILIVHDMTVHKNLIDRVYMNKVRDMVCDGFVGFVGKKKINGFLTFTTGVKIDSGVDGLGQCYKSVDQCDGDVFIVGRGIYDGCVEENVVKYKELCWKGNL
jgi:orotate phosphoribosyltransferase